MDGAEKGDRLLHHAGDVFRHTYVATHGAHHALRDRLDNLFGRRQTLLVPRADADVAAFPREFLGDGEAKPRAPAGDDGGFPVKSQIHFVHPFFEDMRNKPEND